MRDWSTDPPAFDVFDTITFTNGDSEGELTGWVYEVILASCSPATTQWWYTAIVGEVYYSIEGCSMVGNRVIPNPYNKHQYW
jgi:hypothetical protein